MDRLARVLVALMLLALPLVSGCDGAPPSADRTSQGAGRALSAETTTKAPTPTHTLVFDMGHREIFGPSDTSELGQSKAVERMRGAGFDVVVNADTITAEDLEGASGLVLAGPMIPLQDAEYDAITAFAERGGTVLMTIHVPYPVLKVPAHWGLPVQTSILMSDRHYQGADPSVFPATVMKESRLTKGVDAVAVVSGWPVGTASKEAEYVVMTDEAAWVDVNENGATDPGERGPFGVVAATAIGEGFIIVVGDDAVFANLAIGQAGNAQLLDNILELMRGTVDV